MASRLRFILSRDGEILGEYAAGGSVELGRQRAPDEEYPSLQHLEGSACRLVIASAHEKGVSRRHLQLHDLGGDAVTLENCGALPVSVNGQPLWPQDQCTVLLPLALQFGNYVLLRVEGLTGDAHDLRNLAELTLPPFAQRTAESFPTLAVAEGNPADILRWLTNSIDVFQSAATSDVFFERAARAIVEAVGLDSGRVLLYRDGQWATKALYTAPHADEWSGRPSMRVLSHVLHERDTFWELPAAIDSNEASLASVTVVVAAPILDREGQVIGALYGDQHDLPGRPGGRQISRLEGMLVKLLACAVAAGLARLKEEQAALTALGRFEQFFTPELARYLAEHPDLVETGREAEVTVLFCDVRGFSRISEQIGPARTAEWMNSVMDKLSQPVLACDGVLVDYIGDELVAMWGAPAEQPDHAARACRAAVGMLETVAALNDRWQAEHGIPLALGIGINSGMAHVGNTGSRYKFKYGPLGNTVNLASRVQGATKYLRTACLITQATAGRIGPEFSTRRLCRVEVVNIAEPVMLHELLLGEGRQLTEWYEAALDHFERGELTQAVEILGRALPAFPHDGPTQILLKRTAECLAGPAGAFQPVWQLPGK